MSYVRDIEKIMNISNIILKIRIKKLDEIFQKILVKDGQEVLRPLIKRF